MVIESGKTVVVETDVKNQTKETWSGVYVEIEYRRGVVAKSEPVSIPASATQRVLVRISNKAYEPLGITQATFRVRRSDGAILLEEQRPL